MNSKIYLFIFLPIFTVFSCKTNNGDLPYLGETVVENGVEIHHKVGQYAHFNQDSVLIDNKKMSEYIYIVDFFFTSCPSICPKVMKEMTKIYDAVKSEPMVKLVSFTLDPKRDDVAKLKLYANNLGVDHDKWYFLTGDKDATLELANTFFVAAFEDADAPGGFDHSGKILLIDKEGHVRSFSEGTDPENTPKLLADVTKLLASYKNK